MKMSRTWWERALGACVLALSAAAMFACGASPARPGGGETARTARPMSTYHTSGSGGTVPLRDRNGNLIPVGSTSPYSPDRTCGSCHDTLAITQGYHFQQGKGLSNTSIYVSDAYNPARPWLLSDGMYGKW